MVLGGLAPLSPKIMPVVDNTSVHDIARWRRSGHGVWYFAFVVEGYDEDFVMREPGHLSEEFGRKLAALKLAKALKVAPRHVIHRKSAKEV